MFLSGVSYYPEDWSPDLIRADAKKMKEAGMTLVRVGEFAWSHHELSDGKFTFGWLHDAFRIFQKEGLQVILCTPTSAAPAWLVHKHPEILRKSFRGATAYFGVRDHTCYTSEVYLKYAVRLLEHLVPEFKDYPNLHAWQIDNEIGYSIFSNCSCDACRTGFREYLRRKYTSTDELNRAWGNTFWSHEYSSWDQIDIGDLDCGLDSALVLESQRFRSQSMIDFVKTQTAVIRKHSPSAFILSNNYAELGDRHAAFQNLDAAGGDFYVRRTTSLAHSSFECALYRGFKQDVHPWLLEASAAPWTPNENILELLMWHFLAHGFDHQVYFHWRTHPGGFEKNNPSFIGYSGRPRESYFRLVSAMEKLEPLMKKYPELPLPYSEAAVVCDFDSQYIFSQGFWKRAFGYVEKADSFFQTLFALGVNAEVIPVDADFSRFKLLIPGICPHVSGKLGAKLRDFVGNGGTLLMFGESGIYDGNAKYILQAGPEHLQDVFGLEIEDFIVFNRPPSSAFEPGDDPSADEVIFSGSPEGSFIRGYADEWIASVLPKDADVLLKFENTVYQGKPFLTKHAFGKGHAFYCAADKLNPPALTQIVHLVMGTADVAGLPLPAEVEVLTRGPLTFVINYGLSPASFDIPVQGRSLLNDFFQDGHVFLPPHAVCVIENLATQKFECDYNSFTKNRGG